MHVPLKTGYYHIINDEWSNFAALDNLDASGNAIVRAEADDESETIKASWEGLPHREKIRLISGTLSSGTSSSFRTETIYSAAGEIPPGFMQQLADLAPTFPSREHWLITISNG